MIVDIIAEGQELLCGTTPREADVFLRRTESLYAWLLEKEEALPAGCGRAEVSLSIVAPERISDLNLRYRESDKPTDVLSFPLWEEDFIFVPPEGWESIPLGDIVICPDKIMENASENSRSFMKELVLVLSHGLLHLIGYDHCDEDSERTMWALQDRMVDKFFAGEDDGNGR